MKKITLFLMVLILLLTGCSSNPLPEILLSGKIGIQETVEIDRKTLELKLENKEDFVLLLSNPTCSGCINFKPLINEYVKTNEVVIYRIEVNVTDLIAYRYTPTVAIIKGGNIVAKEDPSTKEAIFNKKAELGNFIEKYASLPRLYEVSIDQLRQKIAQGDDFVIYYSWYLCSDCNYLYDNFFKEYLIKNKLTKKIFFIELDQWRAEGRTTDKWKAFAAEFKIDTYGDGRTPSFQYVSNGEVKDMIVVFNELFSVNEARTEVTVTASYYADFPFIGKTYKGEGISEAVSNYRKDTAAFHTKKLTEFLDKNLALAD